MKKTRNFFAILIPSATVFISSACIMALELVASRLVAKHLGSSLYTWTSVIGIVLAGITIGNYIGGRIADRYKPVNALSALFVVASGTCVLTVILNNLVGDWIWLWYLDWPVRVFLHVFLVFMLPSTVLGMISPVVAKMALDQGLRTGRTVGDIYAWGAAGSIAGTFAAGYYLIAAMGTVAIVWTVSGVLLLMGLLYGIRRWIVYPWLALFALALALGAGPWQWCDKAGAAVGLRKTPEPDVIYEDESQYCYIAVKRTSSTQDKRLFIQDKLMHSEIIMDDLDDLLYFHTVVFAAVTHGLADDREALSVMHIGGGGYVFPRYIEKHWPGGRNDVAEIDSRVTEAAMQAFGLERDTKIRTIQMDARNYIDELLQMKKTGGKIPTYDFIYEDAFSDYSVPFQLVTKECNDKIFEILADDGVYMINSIDVYDSALFIGAYVNTLEKTFPYVYIVAPKGPPSNRSLFVVLASKRRIDINEVMRKYRPSQEFWYLDDSEMQTLRERGRGIVLTDDYVPVENMLAPVVRKSAVDLLVGQLQDDIKKFKEQGAWEQVIETYKEIIKLDPTMSLLAYNEIAMTRARQGRMEEAVEAFRSAVEYNENADYKENTANIHLSLGSALRQLGRNREAAEHFQKAAEGYREQLSKDDTSPKIWILLGETMAVTGDFAEASNCFARAVHLDPGAVPVYMKLAQALELQGKYDEAITVVNRAIAVASQAGDQAAAVKLRESRNALEFRKSKKNN